MIDCDDSKKINDTRGHEAGDETLQMGHRLRTTLHRMPSAVPLTLSFGVATWLGGKDMATATLRRADDAMYEAKRLGGDRLVVWQQMRPGLPGGVAVTS
jgi:PleD family two-component response regulator